MLLKTEPTLDTFAYESEHWSGSTLLNQDDLTLLDGDAKYPAFNSQNFTEWLAFWPEFNRTWHIGEFPSRTALEFFQSGRNLTFNATHDSDWEPEFFSSQSGQELYAVAHEDGPYKARWGYAFKYRVRETYRGTSDPSWNWAPDGAGGGLGLAKSTDSLRSASVSSSLSAGDWFACPGEAGLGSLRCGREAPSPGIRRTGGEARYRVVLFGRGPTLQSAPPKWVPLNADEQISFSSDPYFSEYAASGTLFARPCMVYSNRPSSSSTEFFSVRLRSGVSGESSAQSTVFEDAFPLNAGQNEVANHRCGTWHEASTINCGTSDGCRLEVFHEDTQVRVYQFTLEFAVLGVQVSANPSLSACCFPVTRSLPFTTGLPTCRSCNGSSMWAG